MKQALRIIELLMHDCESEDGLAELRKLHKILRDNQEAIEIHASQGFKVDYDNLTYTEGSNVEF